MSKIETQIDEILQLYFPDDYYEIQRKNTVPKLVGLFTGPNLEVLEADRLEWSLETFTEATAISSLRKCEDEIKEIEADLLSDEPQADEYADALMCLLDSAGRAGVSVRSILIAFGDKAALNKMRKWKKNDNNTYSHI